MLLDAFGRPIADTEDVWRVQALFEWLADRRIQSLVARRGVMDPAEIYVFGNMLALELRTRARQAASPLAPTHAQIERKFLKEMMLKLLRDAVVRRSIARHMAQALGWQWKSQRDTRRQLQAEREELEVQTATDSLLWAPPESGES